jgi:hypothetical protein
MSLPEEFLREQLTRSGAEPQTEFLRVWKVQTCVVRRSKT